MPWMNEYDIEEAVDILTRTATEDTAYAARYAVYLDNWKNIINASSDGWPYWTPGSKCADKLMQLVDQAVQHIRFRRHDSEMPTEAQFKKSVTPIKSFATKKDLPQPELPDEVEPSAGMRM